jgi:glycosyltransferase involved in cell wall biosynthesis
VWRERNLASLARSLRADVVLTPVPELPFRSLPVPSVIVVHDVGPLVAPAFYSLPKRLRYQAFLPRTCRQASAVVCVSQATLLGLHAATGIDPDRCEVIGEGPQLLDGTVPREAPDGPYFLYVGSLDPRKNVETLVGAFADGAATPRERLYIVGPIEGRPPAAFRRRLDALAAADRVRHLGYVTPDQLTALYRHASALVLPSVYEGFGLPVLEAMKAATPVVASDIPPLREVAGDAALYVSRPFDSACWREALLRVSEDATLRAELVRRGHDAVQPFVWAEVGRRFSDLLHRVVPDSRRSVSRAGVGVPENVQARGG